MHEMKKYSIYLLSCIFLVLSFVAGFNWFINPYDIFESTAIEGVNKYKSEVERHTRLSKVYQLEKIKPEAVLLASSRGLVVAEEMFAAEHMKGFNLSLTSGSTYELYRMLQHAQQVNPLKRVVLALDELVTGDKQPGFVEDRLAVAYDGSVTPGRFSQKWRDLFSALLSHDALKASLRTIRKQKQSPDSANKDYKADRVRNAGGHRQMFRTMEASMFSDYEGSENQCQQTQWSSESMKLKELVYFEKIVEFSYINDIDLYIYFSPSHARLYEVKCMTGEFPAMAETKRQVVKIVAELAESYMKRPYTVWDFSGYNEVTTEEVPVSGDHSLMRWYWEGSHYTEATAALIFEKIFSLGGGSSEVIDFGAQISVQNIEQHLGKIQDDRLAYIRSYDDIVELNALLHDLNKDK